MSAPLEHDYIGLTEHSLSERGSLRISPSSSVGENDENLRETELRLGLPGSESPHRDLCGFVSGGKRVFSDTIYASSNKWVLSINAATSNNAKLELLSPQPQTKILENKNNNSTNHHANAPAAKAQVVGWPPIRSFRKNTLAANLSKSADVESETAKSGCLYVKVSMDGAPYLRKVDLKHYSNYTELSSALEKMFSCFTIGQCISPNIPGQGGLSESCLMDLLHGSEFVLTYEDKDSDWMLVGDVPWEMFLDSCKRLRIVRSTDAIGLAPRAHCRTRTKTSDA